MTSAAPSWWARLHHALLAVAILLCAVWAMDQLTTRGEHASQLEPTSAPSLSPPGSGRAFVFLVDSLRYANATDPERMPYLSAMRQRGAWGEVISSRDAVTVSAVREMFTGRERFLVFGFMKDFVAGRESVESLFSQMRAAKRSVQVFPHFAFEAFGADLPELPQEDIVDDRDHAAQNRRVQRALRSFLAGEHDLVVTHIIYSDRAAHDYGIHGARYREIFLEVDSVVAELDAAIAPEDTLVVIGDHGHTDNGRHSLGLDVPAFALYRGPAFRAGHDVGTIPVRANRYLLSGALGLPLGGGYDGSAHPDAFAPELVVPASFKQLAPPTRPPNSSAFWWIAALVGALGALWLGIVRQTWCAPRRAIAGVWFALLLGLGSSWHLALPIAALAVAVAVGIAETREQPKAHPWPAGWPLMWIGLGAFLGLGLHAWGRFLAEHRGWIHEPNWTEMHQAAAAVIALAALMAWHIGASRAAWTVIGLVSLLAYPTVYRYGAMPALVTLWLAWIAALLVDARAWRMISQQRAALLKTVALTIALFGFVQPFAFADASNFQFESWHPWVEGPPTGHTDWIRFSLLAKLVIFVRLGAPPKLRPLGVVAAFAMHYFEWNPWPLSRHGVVLLAVALGIAGGWLMRRFPGPVGGELRRVAWLSALTIGFYYLIRLPHDRYAWADCFMAALVISGHLVRRLAPARERASHHAILSVLALGVAGWITTGWTLHLFEWKAMYEWFPASFMENNALFFMPIINYRYLVAVLLLRMVISEQRELDVEPGGAAIAYPHRTVWSAIGVKIVGLSLVLTGFAQVAADSDMYLEAIQEGAVLMILSFGLL